MGTQLCNNLGLLKMWGDNKQNYLAGVGDDPPRLERSVSDGLGFRVGRTRSTIPNLYTLQLI